MCGRSNGSFSNFDDFINASKSLKVNYCVKLVVSQDADIERVEKKVRRSIRGKAFVVSTEISESSIKVEKISLV